MNKLSTMLSTIAMMTALSVSGCGNKGKDENKVDLVAKPTEEALKPSEAKPDTKQPDQAKPAAGDLPAECGEYKVAIDALAACDKLPQATRDALKQSYDQTSTAWASLPAEGKAALGTACKSAADAVKQSAAACK